MAKTNKKIDTKTVKSVNKNIRSSVRKLKPIIKSDGIFKYSSFCPIKTPFGVMKGSYKMRSNAEEVFEAKIATFILRANEYVN